MGSFSSIQNFVVNNPKLVTTGILSLAGIICTSIFFDFSLNPVSDFSHYSALLGFSLGMSSLIFFVTVLTSVIGVREQNRVATVKK